MSLLALGLTACIAGAQTSSYTPPGIPATAAGNPGSSYAQGSVDHVNLYNGNLNVTVPLVGIGGRGDAGYGLVVPIQRRWYVTHSLANGNLEPSTFNDPWSQVDGFGNIVPYSPGILMLRRGSAVPNANSTCPGYGAGPYLTRVVWIAPDTTETVLLDTATGGQPQGSASTACSVMENATMANRGQTFASIDGSDMVFVASTDIYDSQNTSNTGPDPGFVSGTLYFKNGTRYQINGSGQVTQIEDRNGNITTIASGAGTEDVAITDPLGRVSVSALNTQLLNPAIIQSRSTDFVIYPGVGASSTCQFASQIPANCHTIAVNYSQLFYPQGNTTPGALAPGQIPQPLGTLFPELSSGSPTGNFNTTVISSITLADGISGYSFLYDCYGELAQMTLPTGGYYTYSYQGINTCTNGQSSGAIPITAPPGYTIYRRLTERDEYADGVHRSAVTKYSATPGNADPNHRSWATTTTEVDYYAGDGATLLRKELHYFYGDPSSLTSVPNPAAYPNWNDGLEFETQVIDGSTGLTLQTSMAVWTQRPCANPSPVTGLPEVCITPYLSDFTTATGPAHDPVVCQSTTSLDGGGSSGSVFKYDLYNNVTNQYEYNFGYAPPLITASGVTPCPAPTTSTFFRETDTTYNYGTSMVPPPPPPAAPVPPPAPGTPAAANVLNLWNLPQQITVTDTPSGTQSIRNLTYDSPAASGDQPAAIGYDSNRGTARGNLTTDGHVLVTAGGNVTLNHTYQYDLPGNVVLDTDENSPGNVTQYTYSDSFSDSALCSSPQTYSTFATLTGVTLGYSSSTPLSISMCYDYSTGKLTSVTDMNGATSAYSYQNSSGTADPYDRILNISRGNGASKTRFVYQTLVETRRFDDNQVSGDNLTAPLRTDSFIDGLGRPSAEYDYENPTASPPTYIYTCRTYDGLGRVSMVPNPARGYTDCPTAIGATPFTTIIYDSLNRPKVITGPDQTTASATYASASNGDMVTVTDQANNLKRVTVDSAGRVTSVVEDPYGVNALTTYTYNHLDELRTVTQGSQPSRTFTYDTLGRLSTSQQLEYSGQIQYQYYPNGTLQDRTDPNSILTTYSYDSLNRIKQVEYSDGITPTVTYTYDAPGTYSKGRITAVSNTSGAAFNYTGYDALGRVLSSSQTVPGITNPYTLSYQYFASGALNTEQYPSGRKLSMQYDGNNRPTSVSTVASQGFAATPYVSSINYCAHGGIRSLQTGNGLSRFFSYNARLQPTEILEATTEASGASSNCSAVSPNGQNPLLDMQFFWGANGSQTTNNNGLLRSHQVSTGAQSGATSALNVQQVFNYDTLNRIASFTDNGSGTAQQRNFAYTGNNMYVNGTDPFPLSTLTPVDPTAFNTATNRLNTNDPASGQTAVYDNAGNLKSAGNGTSTTYSFTYDAENRQLTQTNSTGAQTQYVYDGEGRRVKTIVGGARGTTTVYVYDAFGRMVADYEDPVGATPCTTCYLSLDHLGSTRMVTDQNQNVVSRHDFMPFGYELASGYAGRGSLWGALDPVRQKYTGDEQDNQDLSFFQARYYLLPQGRFNSPDPVNFGADILNPQSWNGYSYVMNSPLSSVDPDGLGTICNICSTGPAGGDGTSGGDSGGGIDLGFSFGGSAPPPPLTPSVTSSVGVTISAAPLPMGGPLDIFVGPAKQLAADAIELMSRFVNGNNPTGPTRWMLWQLRPTTVKQKAGANGLGILSFAETPLVAGRAFSSFGALKRSLGPAGEGMAVHHIVEQSKAGEFGEGAVHNTANVRTVARGINQTIANYYSSKQPFTSGLTVREWLKGQSWTDQFEFGLRVLRDALNGQLPN